MQSETYSLKNGLKIVLVDTGAFPSLTTLLFVKAGSRYEDKKNNGIAHFFEHMAFKGSKKYPSAQVLAELIEGLGGMFNAFTADDHTGYYVKAPAEDAKTVIDVIGDMIQNPLLKQAEIEKEKGVITQEINMYEDMPQRRVFELFENLLYGGHPLGFDIIGTKANVKSFDQQTFKNYIGQLYHPNNAVLVLAGGLTTKGAGKSNGRTLDYYKKLIEKRFDTWKRHKDIFIPKSARDSQKKSSLILKYKDSDQAHLCFGYRAIPRKDDRRYALSILASILGSGMSSRLFREVREKRGLCYSVRTYIEAYDDVGYIVTYAGVEPNVNKATEALRLIKNEHESIASTGITDKELKRAKEMIKGQMILALEDTFTVASMFGKKMMFENTLLNIQKVHKKYDAVTPKDVQGVAEDLFKTKTSNLALIAPFREDDPFKNVLE